MSDYSISELSALSGLPVRTIRYYVAEGLIPAAGREGPATRYPESTLARLRLVRRLQQVHLPLAEIRRQLAAIPDEAAIDLVAVPEPPAPHSSALDYVRSLLAGESPTSDPAVPAAATRPSSAPPAAPPAPARLSEVREPSYASLASTVAGPEFPVPQPAVGERSSWERVALGPDIELHVRRPLSRRDNRLVERLVAFARQLQQEDAP